MPIPFDNYVDITSGVGAGSDVAERDLITRIFTENVLVPTNSFLDFESADEVGTYFGTTSEEYKRAAFYFAWVSKSITQAKKISYARYTPAAVAPQVFGDPTVPQAVASYTSITTGSLSLTMGAFVFVLTGLNFSAAASLSDVAGVIQAGIRAKTGGGALWTGATVTYDATRGTFNLTGGTTGAAAISVAAGTGVDVAAQLGWLGALTILSKGAAAQTLTECMIASTTLSNNFGSFLFIPTLDADDVTELAAWNATNNVQFMFLVRAANYAAAAAMYAADIDYAGMGATYAPDAGEYDEMVPGVILAATDYTLQNSVQNYMYQKDFPGLTAKVTDGVSSAQFDNVRCNYYGNTQTAGQILNFYQRGVLMGGATAPVDMNVYANEMWLKDAAGARIMELLLDQPIVPANVQGQGQVLGVLQSVIDQALFNGTISVGKPLDVDQKLFINTITGNDRAWRQVQNIGYWINASIISETTQDGRKEYFLVYTLIYSKDDAIRKVNGRHILI